MADAPESVSTAPRSGRLLAVLFGTGLTFLLLALSEGGIRLKDRFLGGPPVQYRTWALYKPDAARGQVLRPGARFLGEGLDVHVNSLGFRGKGIEKEKTPSVLRIAVLGGSAAFGAFSSSDETALPAQIESGLSQSGRKAEVINAGVPGYNTAQMLEHLRLSVLPLKPDLVLFYEAYNDLQVASFPPAPGDYGAFSAWYRERYRPRWWERLRLTGWFGRMLLSGNAEGPSRPPWPQSFAVPEEGISAYGANLRRLVEESRGAGAVPVLLTYAHAIREENLRDHLEKLRGAARHLFYLSPGAAVGGMDQMNEEIRKAAAETGAILIDVEREVPPTFEFFHDHVHFEDVGAARAGGFVAEELRRLPAFGGPAPEKSP